MSDLFSVKWKTESSNLWPQALDKGTTWTFKIDGKEYEIDGALLARIVKLLGEAKQ